MENSMMHTPSSFIWVSEFTPQAAEAFYQKFLELEANPEIKIIPVFINSYGGDVYALNAMKDLMKSSHKPVATIGVGMAMSAGAFLLSAGTKGYRFASPDVKIMIHQVSSLVPGKAADIEESAAQIANLNKMLLSDMAESANKSVKKIEEMIKSKHNADWTLSANEAKKWGFIDHVGVPRIVRNSASITIAQIIVSEEMPTNKKAKKPT